MFFMNTHYSALSVHYFHIIKGEGQNEVNKEVKRLK